VKKVFEKALKAKQEARARNAARSIAEKFRALDRLREGDKQMKAARKISKSRG
jgi:hypothetical protein